jgi:hypothetical protein
MILNSSLVEAEHRDKHCDLEYGIDEYCPGSIYREVLNSRHARECT